MNIRERLRRTAAQEDMLTCEVMQEAADRIEALEALAIQYRDDLRHPPSGDSIDRRVEAVNTILYDSATREKDE